MYYAITIHNNNYLMYLSKLKNKNYHKTKYIIWCLTKIFEVMNHQMYILLFIFQKNVFQKMHCCPAFVIDTFKYILIY